MLAAASTVRRRRKPSESKLKKIKIIKYNPLDQYACHFSGIKYTKMGSAHQLN